MTVTSNSENDATPKPKARAANAAKPAGLRARGIAVQPVQTPTQAPNATAAPNPKRRRVTTDASASRANPADTNSELADLAQRRANREARQQRLAQAEIDRNRDETTPPPAKPGTLVSDSSPPQPAAVFAAGPVDLLSAGEQRMFSRTTRWSFIALVILPFIAACFYLFTMAADRYAVEVKFAVRSPNGLPASDLIGMVTGGAAGTTRSDAYMVVEYLQSRQFLDEMLTRIDLNAIYAIPSADPLMRLASGASKEDQVDYLARVVRPSYDATTEIITVESQAFSPQDALRVANGVLETAGAMVNRLSEQARQDTVRLAQSELTRAEAALKAQRRAIATFREAEQSIDPKQSVATQENVLRDLQTQLAVARAEMRSLREFLSAEAPSIRVLRSQIASIENQIAQERANLGRGRPTSSDGTQADSAQTLNSAVSLYEALAVDLEFHERAYVSALSSLESARVEADRQQRYLAAVVYPALPEAAIYPRVILSLALVFAVCFFTWGILAMFIHVIREHMR